MFHYTNQRASSSSRRLTSSDRLMNERMSNEVYFHPYDGSSSGAVPGRAAISTGSQHSRSTSDYTSYSSHPTTLRQSYPVMEMEDEYESELDDEDDDDEEAMEILYEDQLPHHHHVRSSHAAAAEQVNNAPGGDLELQLTEASDHLLALLQREANDYSTPLPVRYYPTEFAEVDSSTEEEDGSGGDDKPAKKTTIGPWRKRIASWMYDVVDHFQYDRNVVSIALRFIDQYVSHLLVESSRNHRRSDSGIGSSRGSSSSSSSSSSSQPIKRRHFQLIAVTSLYLAIKVHGELMEDDPTSGAEYDVVASLVDEVDGRMFLGKPLSENDGKIDDEEDASSQESDEDLRDVSHKITDLKRRQRKGRWSMGRFALPLGGGNPSHGANYANDLSSSSTHTVQKQPKHAHSSLPYKPRKRGMLGGPLRLHSFVELSRGLFTSQDITDTEKKILIALNYVVNPPTSRRFTGELLRMLALSYCSSVDGRTTNTAVTATAAERILGLDRKDILQKVLNNACTQIEGAASVPALSIGCLPSVVAYGAMLNAVEEEFEKVASSSDRMEMEKDTAGQSPQLEDFQRHYRRYSRNTSPSPLSASSSPESDRELFLEAWKEQFLVTVFHATNCFLSPDSQDVFKIRELLLDQVEDNRDASAADSSSPLSASSPTETSKLSQDGLKKRSPRSPRSVAIGPNPRMLRGNSFLQLQGSSFSRQSASLLSPYDSSGRATSTSSIGSLGENKAVSYRRASASDNTYHRSYYKQTSEPLAEAAVASVIDGRFARAQTPDVISMFRRQQQVGSNYEEGSYQSFNPPNPIFSA